MRVSSKNVSGNVNWKEPFSDGVWLFIIGIMDILKPDWLAHL